MTDHVEQEMPEINEQDPPLVEQTFTARPEDIIAGKLEALVEGFWDVRTVAAEIATALFSAGTLRIPPNLVIDKTKLVVHQGWLCCELGGEDCTCAGADFGGMYGHESHCGLEPLLPMDSVQAAIDRSKETPGEPV